MINKEDEENLEAAIATWCIVPNGISKNLDENKRKALEIMFNQSKLTCDVTITLQGIMNGTGLNMAKTEKLMKKLGKMRCVSCHGDLYKLTHEGYEVFEPEFAVLSRIVTNLDKMHQMGMNWIRLPAIAKKAGLGEFSITAYYLQRLGEKIVTVKQYTVGTERYTDARLTELGRHLADYLIS